MILLAFVPFKVYNKSNFRGRLIHRSINKWDFLPPKIGVDLYTSSTYTPENTIVILIITTFFKNTLFTKDKFVVKEKKDIPKLAVNIASSD